MRNKSPLTFYHFLLIIGITIFSVNTAIAQENGIYEIENSSNLSENSSAKITFQKTKIKKYKDVSRNKFYVLTQKLHNTAYIKNNTVTKIYGKGPIKKITFLDSKTSSFQNKKDSKYDNVELITVTLKNLSDLNNKLDLSSIQSNSNLKYVFIKCYFKCTKKQIKNFVKIKPKSHIRIFYTLHSVSQ